MTSIAQTLRAFEARAESALTQDLRQMARDILAMRPLLLRQEREQADALTLKLLHRARHQEAQAGSASKAPTPAPLYLVVLHDPEDGTPKDAITLEGFDAGVQFVLDRLETRSACVIDAKCSDGHGSMKVRSSRGAVLATVAPAAATDTTVPVQAAVSRACQALQAGDASRLDSLFKVMLKAA